MTVEMQVTKYNTTQATMSVSPSSSARQKTAARMCRMANPIQRAPKFPAWALGEVAR